MRLLSQTLTRMKDYIASQAALMLVICNDYLDDDCRLSEGEIKDKIYDLIDMIQ